VPPPTHRNARALETTNAVALAKKLLPAWPPSSGPVRIEFGRTVVTVVGNVRRRRLAEKSTFMNPAQATELARAEFQSGMGADQMPTVRMHAPNSRQRRLREGCFTIHVVDMYATLFLLGGGTRSR
jgi:hypothetical protein